MNILEGSKVKIGEKRGDLIISKRPQYPGLGNSQNGEKQMQAKLIEQCDLSFAEENTYSKQIAPQFVLTD